MASKSWRRLYRAGFSPASAVTAAAAVGLSIPTRHFTAYAEEQFRNADVEQYNTSSQYVVPSNWKGPTFKVKLDYGGLPPPSSVNSRGLLPGPGMPLPGDFDPRRDAPWLEVDFEKDPAYYCAIVKEYCWEGNVNNNFDIWKNQIRQWYHAPWMHYGPTGREPISGLTFERSLPKGEFSKNQNRVIQNWAVGFYNSIGATVFNNIWQDPSKPNFNENIDFPLGTCVFKVLMTEATDGEIESMVGSPSLPAKICPPLTSANLYGPPLVEGSNKKLRVENDFVSQVRLIQVDFAVRDDRAPIGWVFGTFMYDKDAKPSNPWDKIIPVGLMWGNDPELTDTAANEKPPATPKEGWINPRADQIRESLGGSRPSWGLYGRMNGPADNFISACSSCHSTAQRDIIKDVTGTKVLSSGMIPPTLTSNPSNEQTRMRWFRNLPRLTAFDDDLGPKLKNFSADYSLQLSKGIQNYNAWKNPEATSWLGLGKKLVFQEPQHALPDTAQVSVRY